MIAASANNRMSIVVKPPTVGKETRTTTLRSVGLLRERLMISARLTGMLSCRRIPYIGNSFAFRGNFLRIYLAMQDASPLAELRHDTRALDTESCVPDSEKLERKLRRPPPGCQAQARASRRNLVCSATLLVPRNTRSSSAEYPRSPGPPRGAT